eukprot:SM000157S02083  [mRNA]  locus=s157:176844:183156:- [translate_table: standard]
MSADDSEDVFKVLVATDCHLGFMEKDEIRREDSFAAFEEICKIAERQKVDFMLLGGDLFHENKPSRTTLVRTIELLRRYCLNNHPVKFQVVSDQTVNFSQGFGHVNYEDPHYNVGMPVFTIHGNHDDPAGVDNLSAIDILSTCNLVNYFGKMVLGGSGVGEIKLHPILLCKGKSRIALYGMGNIRDERLNRMFQTPHAVQWIRPEAQEDCSVSDWFNILVLHQNRVKANPKNAINEHFLAKFLDFVIWGHEHECLVDPQEVPGMGFHISQPGSSVATSLIDGEAAPKHVLLLEIKGSQYRPTKIPLQSVRPFKFADVSLKEQSDLNAADEGAVLKFLEGKVHEMINLAGLHREEEAPPMLPLIRVRVDYTGFTTINPQRFGQRFVGKVANPHDILLFTKAPKKRATADEKIEDVEMLRPEELNQQNIEALVGESNLSKLVKEGEENQLLEERDVLEMVNHHIQVREAQEAARQAAGLTARVGHQDVLLNGQRQERPVENVHRRESVKRSADALDMNGEEDPIGEDPSTPSTSGRTSSAKGSRRGRGRGASRGRILSQSTLDTPSPRQNRRASAAAAATMIREAVNGLDDDDDIASDSDHEVAREAEEDQEDEVGQPVSAGGVMRTDQKQNSCRTGVTCSTFRCTCSSARPATPTKAATPTNDTRRLQEPARSPHRGRGRKRATGSGRGRGAAAKRGKNPAGATPAQRKSLILEDDKDDEDDNEDDVPLRSQHSQLRRSAGESETVGILAKIVERRDSCLHCLSGDERAWIMDSRDHTPATLFSKPYNATVVVGRCSAGWLVGLDLLLPFES